MVIMKGWDYMMSLNGGYAMIKHNSTQEELQIAYRSKRPVLFYDENQRAHWAVIEETTTQSVDEETQEPITLYEYSYRLLDEASEVVANPTLSGNEATLNGLDIDGTKYKVGGGSGTITLDDIVDKNGNKRFVEGDGEAGTLNDATILYNKWSLSGTHLMCVVVFKTGGGNISSLEKLAEYSLPDYIYNKIIASTSDGTHIVENLYPIDNLRVTVVKLNNKLYFQNNGTLYANSQYRIQCDLLIDSE